jgi:hypothetical protein
MQEEKQALAKKTEQRQKLRSSKATEKEGQVSDPT